MLSQEVADLLQHAFRQLHPGIWFIVHDDDNTFTPSLRSGLSLRPYLYSKLLQLSGIRKRYGNKYRFNMRVSDYIKVSFQENFTINISKSHMERGGKNRLLLCIDAPIYKCPHDQANSRRHLNVWSNQLEGPYLALLNQLIDRQPPSPGQIIEELPMLEEEAEVE